MIVLGGCPAPYPLWNGDGGWRDVREDRVVDVADSAIDAEGSDAADAPAEADVTVDLDAADSSDSPDAGLDAPEVDAPDAEDALIPAYPDGGCPGGLTNCFDFCRDLDTDPFTCGSCSGRCHPGYTCSSRACVCPGPSIVCTGVTTVCIDPSATTDCMNCGACGRQCNAGEWCVAGGCRTDCTTVCGTADCSMCPTRRLCM